MKRLILALTFYLLFLPACQNQGSNDKAAQNQAPAQVDLESQLAHHNFVLMQFDGRPVADVDASGQPRPRPNIDFGQWPTATGKFCNNYNGQMQLEGETLTIQSGAMTMMLCMDSDLDELERTFHQMLANGAKVAIDGQNLTLSNQEHSLVFQLADHVS